MDSILEQLLAIQGATEQQTIDALIETRTEATRRPQEREERSGCVEPPPDQEKPSESPPGPQKRDSLPMLEAWRAMYRIFAKYAPALRQAAAQDGETNDEACRLFSELWPEVEALSKIGGDAKILAAHVYDMLSDVWGKARNDT